MWLSKDVKYITNTNKLRQNEQRRCKIIGQDYIDYIDNAECFDHISSSVFLSNGRI